MIPSNEESPVGDVAYLARSDHRAPTLVALAAGARSRTELRETTGVSPSTIRRTLREFEARNWVRRDGPRYEATPLGAYVGAAVAELIERVEIERNLRDVWQWLPDEGSGFTIEMCADAVVTVPESDNPYAPTNRFLELVEETDGFRFLGHDVALIEPCREKFCQQVIDGMRTEIVDPPGVAAYARSTYPDLSAETQASGNLDVWVSDELPSYGVGIFDDRVAVCGHDPDSVTVRVLLDTDSEAARQWAESRFDCYRHRPATVPLETAVE